MMQNGGDYAKIYGVILKQLSIKGENVGEFYSTWNPGVNLMLCQGWETVSVNRCFYGKASSKVIGKW